TIFDELTDNADDATVDWLASGQGILEGLLAGDPTPTPAVWLGEDGSTELGIYVSNDTHNLSIELGDTGDVTAMTVFAVSAGNDDIIIASTSGDPAITLGGIVEAFPQFNLVEGDGGEVVDGEAVVFDGLAFAADSTVEAFEGASAQAIADATDDAAEGNYVIEYTKTPTSKNYAGVKVGNLEDNLVDAIPFDIDGGATTITARIYTAEAGKVVRMQVVDSASDNDANWVHAQATLESVGWNTVTFDFSSPVARWVNANNGESAVALSADVTYDEISIFPDWENGLDYAGADVGTPLTEDAVYLIDDVKMAEAPTEEGDGGEVVDGGGEVVDGEGGSSESFSLEGVKLIIETGANYQDDVLENSWTYVKTTNGKFLAGEETFNGITSVFGEDRVTLSEAVAGLDDLPTLDPSDEVDLAEINKLPDALKVYNEDGTLGVISMLEETFGEGEYSQTRTSYIDPDGAVLGYSNTYSWEGDEYGPGVSGVNYETADFHRLGFREVGDDGSTKSMVTGVLKDNSGAVIGSTETITDSNPAQDFLEIWVYRYNTNGEPLGSTETVTSGDSTVITEYDSDGNSIGSFDADGNILDPLAVFQIGSMVFEDGAVRAYAEDNNVTSFYDGDENGQPDILEMDGDENGIPDYQQWYAEDILFDAILGAGFKPEPVTETEGDVTSVVGFQTATENYFVNLIGDFVMDLEADDAQPSGTVTGIEVYASVAAEAAEGVYVGADENSYEAGDLIASSS
ncbi:hypothetical protein OAU07_08125, partial [Alphaproteobacteria bacterium]|nr:hypothetical protein [Alphaproteobacteria bacterium]